MLAEAIINRINWYAQCLGLVWENDTLGEIDLVIDCLQADLELLKVAIRKGGDE